MMIDKNDRASKQDKEGGAQKSVAQKELGGSKDQFWNPRFWNGMTVSAWAKAAWAGRLRITPKRYVMAGIISGLSGVNSTLAMMQHLVYGRKIARQALHDSPVFVIGHWRSGTTLLHEYLIRDEQFTFSDTYTCFAPAHFIFSGPFFRPWVQWLMPKKRPMDNMAVGLDRPQEDEFALCALGLPSTYLDMMYPNVPPLHEEYLTLRDITPEQCKKWLDSFEWLLKALTVHCDRRIVLKSPPHTGRIRTILERFPHAKFIHLHRNPYTLFPSTYTLWTRLAAVHGLQYPNGIGLEEKVFSQFERMDDAFEKDRSLLEENQLIEVAYQELVESPVDSLEKIYQQLELGDFEAVRPEFAQFAATQKSYKKNKFNISPEIKEGIDLRWRNYIERYGYTVDEIV